jgi:DNA-binding MarR family transcriptional regulator
MRNPTEHATRAKSPAASAAAMDRMIREILFTFFRLNAAGERLFHGTDRTPGQMSLMRSIYEEGPQSVAQIARARPVARQAVQRMADQLAAAGLVEFAENPAHLRAKLVRLSPAGGRVIERLLADTLAWAGTLARDFDEREVHTVVEAMRKLKAALVRDEARRPAPFSRPAQRRAGVKARRRRS